MVSLAIYPVLSLAEVVVAQRLVNNGDNVISPCSACGTGHVV